MYEVLVVLERRGWQRSLGGLALGLFPSFLPLLNLDCLRLWPFSILLLGLCNSVLVGIRTVSRSGFGARHGGSESRVAHAGGMAVRYLLGEKWAGGYFVPVDLYRHFKSVEAIQAATWIMLMENENW